MDSKSDTAFLSFKAFINVGAIFLAILSRNVPIAISIVNPITVCRPTPLVKIISVCPPVTSTLKNGNWILSIMFCSARTSRGVKQWASRWLTGMTGRSNLFPRACAKFIPAFKPGNYPGPIVTAMASRSPIETPLCSSDLSTTTGSASLWCYPARTGASSPLTPSLNLSLSLDKMLPHEDTTAEHVSSNEVSTPSISLCFFPLYYLRPRSSAFVV